MPYPIQPPAILCSLRTIACDHPEGTEDDCAALAHPLPPNAALPDHVCRIALCASTANWLFEHFPGFMVYPTHGPRDQMISIVPGVSIAFKSISDYPYTIWPNEGSLCGIVRQWAVRTDGNRANLAKRLERRPEFRALIEWLGRPDTHFQEPDAGSRDDFIERGLRETETNEAGCLQSRLATLGLPATPQTARYAAARARGTCLDDTPDQDSPAIGLLVTSFLIRPPISPPDHPALTDPVTFTDISGALSWSNDALFAVAKRTANAHKQWWARLSPALADDARKSNTGSLPGDPLDADISAGMDRHTLYDREWARYQNAHPTTWTPTDRRKVEAKVRSRLNRRRNATDPDSPK